MRTPVFVFFAAFSVQPVHAAEIGGSWDVQYCWEGNACQSDILNIEQRGRRIHDEDYPGQGITVGPLVLLKYDEDCTPLYKSFNADSESMSGTMSCLTDSSDRGRWTATRLVR